MFSPDELRELAEICLDRGLWIISDEIHCDLTLGGSVHTPIASLSPEIAERTITLMAPSKTFNLAGLKASIAVITNPELRARFESGKAGMVGAVNILGYTAMTAAYRDCDDWLAELTAYLTANRDHVSAVVAERMPKLRLYPAEATYLAWIDGNGLGAPGNDAAAWFLGNARVAFGDGAKRSRKIAGEGGDGAFHLVVERRGELVAQRFQRFGLRRERGFELVGGGL